MIEEIVHLYHEFGDAVLHKVVTVLDRDTTDGKIVKIYITCLNWETGERQKIELCLKGVFHFQYLENEKIQNSVVFEALIEGNTNHITVDFFPIQVDGLGKLMADPKSSFLVRCKKISYSIVH